jgi:quercetin dioxygenase-like cupin family protein
METFMSTALKSEVVNIANLVEYQTGTIVSKQINNLNGGNITLFAFDFGQELSEHTSPFNAFVHVLDGEVEITISGKVFNLKKGEAISIPGNQPHAVNAIKKFKMLLTMIKV